MLFQPFQPSLMRVEKVEQLNQPETVDPNRTRPKFVRGSVSLDCRLRLVENYFCIIF